MSERSEIPGGSSGALVLARGLRKHFPRRRAGIGSPGGSVRAVDGVDLELTRGRAHALVGESGCGKTTLGLLLVRLVEPTSGSVMFDGEDLLALHGSRLRNRRRDFQMVFQDPHGSLNPRLTVRQTIAEPLEVHGLAKGAELERRVGQLVEMVGLTAAAAERYPHEFSGGQRQRIGIARALATEPRLLVADEPVTALDVSVQAQIVNVLARLQNDLKLTLLFIGHDLAVVEQLADRTAVMYLGRIVEEGETADLFDSPLHPYTVSLLSAIPAAEPGRERSRVVLEGETPDPATPPTGCRFHPRCPIARARCRGEDPGLVASGPGRSVACHFPGEMRWPGNA